MCSQQWIPCAASDGLQADPRRSQEFAGRNDDLELRRKKRELADKEAEIEDRSARLQMERSGLCIKVQV